MTDGAKSANQAIGFIGLGAMGAGMAQSLVRGGFVVKGCDIRADAVEALCAKGGMAAATPADAADGSALVVVVVINAGQAEEVLFGPTGAVGAMQAGSTVMLCVTVPPDYARDVEKRLGEKGVHFLDAPISGGAAKAMEGTMTIMASGSADAFAASDAPMDAMAEKIYRLGDAAGPASTVKMINQLLAGVHIAAFGEAMAMGTAAGADPNALYEVISNSAGSSWMFQNRVPQILAGDYTPLSALNIFVKDLGIVLEAGKAMRFPLPVSAAAHQVFMMGAAAGLGDEADAGVVRVYEPYAGIDVAEIAKKYRGEA
ncbi:MAG: NAD-binding protein [Rhodospirillales bacterium]|jgi:L-threonate 2-dehydrogenase|nr:NAD-binding protein [Rhodospirillales bacterium]